LHHLLTILPIPAAALTTSSVIAIFSSQLFSSSITSWSNSDAITLTISFVMAVFSRLSNCCITFSPLFQFSATARTKQSDLRHIGREEVRAVRHSQAACRFRCQLGLRSGIFQALYRNRSRNVEYTPILSLICNSGGACEHFLRPLPVSSATLACL